MYHKLKSLRPVFLVAILLFGGSYLYRRLRDNDIVENSRFTFGQVFKKTGSLKNGNYWHYRFVYDGKKYEDYRPTHADYDVEVGQYFLINFSSRNPEHSKILYEFKLRQTINPDTLRRVWNIIPQSFIESSRRTD